MVGKEEWQMCIAGPSLEKVATSDLCKETTAQAKDRLFKWSSIGELSKLTGLNKSEKIWQTQSSMFHKIVQVVIDIVLSLWVQKHLK